MFEKGKIRTKFLRTMMRVECILLLICSLLFGVVYTKYSVDKHLAIIENALENEVQAFQMLQQKEVSRCDVLVQNDVLLANLNREYHKDLAERLRFKSQLRSVVSLFDIYEVEAGTSYLIYTDNYDLVVDDHMKKLEELPQTEAVTAFLQNERLRTVWDIQKKENEVFAVRYTRFYARSQYTSVLSCAIPISTVIMEKVETELQENGDYLCYQKSGKVICSASQTHPVGSTFSSEKVKCGYLIERALLDNLYLVVIVSGGIWVKFGLRALGIIFLVFIALAAFALINAYIASQSATKEIEDFGRKISESPLLYLDNRNRDQLGILELDQIEKSFVDVLAEVNRLHISNLEKEKRANSLEMDLLQARINPHLIYNSLSIIKWRMLDRGEHKDAEIVDALSRYYRIALSKGQTMICLEQELKMLRAYVHLVECTKEVEIDMQISVPDEMMDCGVHKHLLQPFVENAVMHGFDLQSDERKLLWICVQRVDDDVRILICDNGVGISDEVATQLEKGLYHSEYGGYGISNVVERLKHSYGEAYQLRISTRQAGGTQIELRYPYLQLSDIM